MFDKIEDDFAQSGGDEVGGVAEEDVASRLCANLWIEEIFALVFGYGFIGKAPATLKSVMGLAPFNMNFRKGTPSCSRYQ